MTTESDAGIREGLPMPVHEIAEPRLRLGPDSLVSRRRVTGSRGRCAGAV
ncbi:hypothetical protein [Nocardia sp. NPDC002869]